MKFEGWLPNATGNISFSAVGTSLKKGVQTRSGFWRPDRRWVVCSQARKNTDRQLPLPVLQALNAVARRPAPKRIAQSLTYALTARSENAGADAEGILAGQIVILVPEDPASASGLTALGSLARDLTTAQAEARAQRLPADPDVGWGASELTIRQAGAFTCNFRLLRNGKCFFDATSAAAATPPLHPDAVEWLVSQCYYFLKDSVHHHYHHRTNTDAIIEVTNVASQADWRARTQRNLFRKVISLRRAMNEERLSNALGVLAYARVFNELFGQSDYNEDGTARSGASPLPKYSDDLRTSIEVRRDSAAQNNAKRKTDAQFFIASALAIAALFISLYEHFAAGSQAQSIGNLLVSILGTNPWLMLTVVASLYVVYSIYTGAKDSADLSFSRWWYRLTAWLPRWALVTFATLLVVFLLAGGGTLLWLASKPAPETVAGRSAGTGHSVRNALPQKVGKQKLDKSNARPRVQKPVNLSPPTPKPAKAPTAS